MIPYGPVRSGVFEAIQFQIETGGETVERLQTRPFFKHRGMEARFAGLRPDRAVYVAERVAGIATVAYASAFSQAVERAVGVQPPPAAERWRAVYAELERLACHFDVIAKEAETTALYVGQARFQILKEQVIRLRARLSGSRFARGVIVPGGVRHVGALRVDGVSLALDGLETQLIRDRKLFLGTASMTDRLIGAGRLPRTLVEEYAAVGPLARGVGHLYRRAPRAPLRRLSTPRPAGDHPSRRRRDGAHQREVRRGVRVAADPASGDRSAETRRR